MCIRDSIDPDGKVGYLGPQDKGVERMPLWLRKVWLEYYW